MLLQGGAELGRSGELVEERQTSADLRREGKCQQGESHVGVLGHVPSRDAGVTCLHTSTFGSSPKKRERDTAAVD